jgi:hypothetical protein
MTLAYDDVEAVDVTDLPAKFIECRFEHRHRLYRMPDPKWDADHTVPFGWRSFHYYCDNCGSKRHTLRARGQKSKHTYEHPSGYKVVGEDINLKVWDAYLALDDSGQIRSKKPPRAPRRLLAAVS